ncbi:MAG: iron-containing alcohol dehydrogenase [Candidatus Altiarchaeota archaeon]
MMAASFRYYMPTEVRFGCGVLEDVKPVVEGLEAKRVLIVTGKSAAWKRGVIDRIKELLDGKEITVFDDVESDPSVETVDKAVYATSDVDVILGLGGGSPLDVAKAASVVSANGGKAVEYIRGKGIMKAGPPVIAIPTTAGTGSEVTEVAVLSDRSRMVKKSFRSRHMYPSAALDDPQLTVTMPKEVTASSGLDALTHAIEALTSKMSQPMPDVLCMEAAKLVLDNIVRAYDDDSDMEAREAMMLGSLMAGFGITHAGAGLAHGLSYSLWKAADTPHGLACGVVLPHVMRLNLGYEKGKYDQLARHCRLKDAQELILKVEEIKAALSVPDFLRDVGVKADDIGGMVELGLSGSTRGNPRPVDWETLNLFLRGII